MSRVYMDCVNYDLSNFYSLCCAFLAFKIDEYNVTLEQFIETLSPFFSGQQLQHISDFILSHEVRAMWPFQWEEEIPLPYKHVT